jgi:hypothetical protein
MGDENEEVYDEDSEEYDDGDALSSSPSIPDDVCLFSLPTFVANSHVN